MQLTMELISAIRRNLNSKLEVSRGKLLTHSRSRQMRAGHLLTEARRLALVGFSLNSVEQKQRRKATQERDVRLKGRQSMSNSAGHTREKRCSEASMAGWAS